MGRDSWAFFRILGLECGFLNHPVEEWPSRQDYLIAEEVVSSLSVVNDAAERGVKLCSDFLPSAKGDGILQSVLQVVENNRARKGNQRKDKQETKRWFLTLD